MIYSNNQSDLALKFIRHTGMNIFLTGKAGTGKTTFLKQLRELSPKRMIVVAPTGVAAINAGGVTIHSFFQLPFGPYVPGSGKTQSEGSKTITNRFSKEKINIIRSIDLLVIDEISMVRADLLDAVSDVLRRYRNPSLPFGGVQLLLIGDLQQLAPVAKDEEWALLKQFYNSPFFFDSQALKSCPYMSIELTHVYRQNDSTFVSLLNNIRENRFDEHTLQELNKRYIPDFHPDDDVGYITLTTHNYLAQQINNQKLSELPGKIYTYKATIEKEYPPYLYPTDETLELKTGAQVMFIKNDSSGERQYYNGKIGRIVFINSEKIVVVDENGDEIYVNKETWYNTKYSIDSETKEIEETIMGSFSQFPLKTAWAITIHKSQGLTFEKAIIDAAAAFSHGQVYVALSRCRSLEGLVLSTPVGRNAMISDNRIEQYNDYLPQIQANEVALSQAKQIYFTSLVTELFDFSTLHRRMDSLYLTLSNHLSKLYPIVCSQYSHARDLVRGEILEIGIRFQQQLKRMILESNDYQQDETIQERIRKGCSYFLEKIEAHCDSLPDISEFEVDNKEATKAITTVFDKYVGELNTKRSTLEAGKNSFSISKYLSAKAKSLVEVTKEKKRKKQREPKKEKEKKTVQTAEYTATDIKHPALYNMIRQWRSEVAAEKGVPVYTILQQKALIGIASALPVNRQELLTISGIGKKVLENYGEALLEIIDTYRSKMI